MTNPAGESNGEALKLDFDRRLMLQFQGSVVTSDAGLFVHRSTNSSWESSRFMKFLCPEPSQNS